MFSYLIDSLLRFLQRRCEHNAYMVTSDLLEGADKIISVKYCNRCGAVRVIWENNQNSIHWRLPDPFLWRGR